MRIGVLSDPNNFHTQKWVKALQKAGAEVFVFSFDSYSKQDIKAIQLPTPIGKKPSYSYLDYLFGGKILRKALVEHNIDLLNPLNITPFGVWAMQSKFKPVIACAFGADILEYPPHLNNDPQLLARSWDNQEIQLSSKQKFIQTQKRKFYRNRVAAALDYADLITGDNQYLVDCMADWFSIPKQKLALLRWGVEPELFEQSAESRAVIQKKFGLKDGQKMILSPRGAKPIYQADIILDAFEQLLQNSQLNAKLIMLGAGYSVSPSVSKKAKMLMESFPNFHFEEDALPREEVYSLWNWANIFISAPIYDGYSAALAEGRYIGAIPVVNSIPANLELIVHQENGWIVEPFEARKLAQDLQFLLENFEEIQPRIANSNRIWIEENSIMDRNAIRFIEFAKSIISNSFKS